MELQVIRLETQHIEECVDLFIDTFSREPWNDVYDSREQVKEFFQNHMDNNYYLGYGGWINGEIKALSIGMKKPWIGGMEYYIAEFCISTECQGKGLGGMFLKQIDEMLLEEKVTGMFLNTEKEYPSYGFYKKNGFEQIGNLVVLAK